MNDQKLCESAYLTAEDPQEGAAIHGAAMIDRTGGTTHLYLVRGKCSDSVVTELHRQLIRAGRLPHSTSRRTGAVLPALLMVATAALVVGVLTMFLGSSGTR